MLIDCTPSPCLEIPEGAALIGQGEIVTYGSLKAAYEGKKYDFYRHWGETFARDKKGKTLRLYYAVYFND